MLQQVIITGAKRSKGDIEGRPYDSTKIYVQTKMNSDNGEMIGFATSEYNWGLSDNFEKLRGLKFPIHADIEMEIVTSGRSTKMIVTDVIPKAAPAAVSVTVNK